MAEKVFFHLGLPKTGTTYLQSVLWSNKEALRDQGLLLPGSSARQHMQASVVVREHPGLPNRAPEVRESWAGLVDEIKAWPHAALISHEFFGAATHDQAARAMAAVGDAEIELIVTARDLLTILTSYWQEYVKHGFVAGLDDFPPAESAHDEWTWDTVDLPGVVQRWGADLDPSRVHVLVLPAPGAPKELLLQQFCGLLGVDPSELATDQAREYRSLGVVEAELLRRLSPQLTTFTSARDRGVWIRSYLAQSKLVSRGGERFLPSPDRVEALRARAHEGVDFIRASGVDVVGDLDRLEVPKDLPDLRHPSSVTEAEMLDAATAVLADVLTDVRAFREHNTALRKAAVTPTLVDVPPGSPAATAGSSPLAMRVLKRLGRRSSDH